MKSSKRKILFYKKRKKSVVPNRVLRSREFSWERSVVMARAELFEDVMGNLADTRGQIEVRFKKPSDINWCNANGESGLRSLEDIWKEVYKKVGRIPGSKTRFRLVFLDEDTASKYNNLVEEISLLLSTKEVVLMGEVLSILDKNKQGLESTQIFKMIHVDFFSKDPLQLNIATGEVDKDGNLIRYYPSFHPDTAFLHYAVLVYLEE